MVNVTLLEPRYTSQPDPTPSAQSLNASECAEVIARMRYKAGALRRINPDIPWDGAHPMERSRHRTAAENFVALEIPAVERAAATETVTWVREKLRAELGADYPEFHGGAFADKLIEDAVRLALENHDLMVAQVARQIGRAK